MTDRVARSHAEARTTYDRLSRFYDLLAGASERPCREAGLDRLALGPGERVVEIGCGTGPALPRMARAVGPSGRVIGVDLSTGMLGRARARLAGASLPAPTGLVAADALRLPLPCGAADALFAAFVLELFDTPEVPAVLAGWRQVLGPGGRAAVVSLLEAPGAATWIYGRAHRWMPRLVDCRPIPLGAWLAEAGFVEVDVVERRMWGLPVGVALARS